MSNYVTIRNNFYGIVLLDKEGKEIKFVEKGKKIKLVQVLLNLENDECTWKLRFEYKGKEVFLDFQRGDIVDKSCLKELIKKGADIKPRNTNIAIESIMLQEENAPIDYTYENVGWVEFPNDSGGDFCYRAENLIGESGEYSGKYKLAPMGSFGGWKAMIQNEVLGITSLEVILIASLSAIINGIIAQSTTGENPIFHICLASGQGKSSIGYVCCSAYGEPFEGSKKVTDAYGNSKNKKSVFGSWAATENALITDNCGNQGVCVILNEIGKYQGKDLTSVVYGLSDGVDKNRLNEKYKGSVGENFCTSIISIGESSLIQKCATKEQGVKIRVMEIDTPLTNSADHSRRLKKGSRENNGWAAQILSQYIIDNGGKDYVLDIYNEYLEALTESETDGDKIRFTEKFTALLATTAFIANEAFDISFDIPAIVDFCNERWESKNAENGDVDQCYLDTIEKLRVHEANFYKDTNLTYTPQKVWGSISYPNIIKDKKILATEFAVRSNELKNLLDSMGYKNPTTYLKKWRDKGVLNHEEGKLLNRRVIVPGSKVKESVYVIQVWEDLPQESEDTGNE